MSASASEFRAIAECLVCGSDEMEEVFDLGAQPLANAWPETPQELPRYPLRLMACRRCAHCQQAIAVSPKILYRHYPYVSGTSKTLDDYFRRFAEDAEKEHGGAKPLRVLDIGGNDGTLLKHFKARGHETVSVDPARNLAPLAEKKGIETHAEFWSESFAQEWGRSFDIITALNVLAHVASPMIFSKAAEERSRRAAFFWRKPPTRICSPMASLTRSTMSITPSSKARARGV